MTQPHSSLDQRVEQAMRAFDPTPAQTSRMRASVLASHATLHRPLRLEWIALLRSRPVLHTTLALAATVVLMISTPLGGATWFAWKTFRASASEGQLAAIDWPSAPDGNRGPHVEEQRMVRRIDRGPDDRVLEALARQVSPRNRLSHGSPRRWFVSRSRRGCRTGKA